jgi:hypothetical protein
MLVDHIVTAQWRLRRALKAEAGEIALSVDEGHWQRRFKPELFNVQLHLADDPMLALQDSAIGNSSLAKTLRGLRGRVEKEGELTEDAIKNAFGPPNKYSNQFEKLRLRLSQNTNGADEAARREENKKQALSFIDHKLGTVGWLQEKCAKREAAEEEARQAAAVLPSMEVLEKILRYETKLERQMYRAMSQLERLQRMRRGENVPPPLTMEVSERP